MARLLYIRSHCSEDPRRASLPFFMAKGAIDAGHKPEIVLAGDGAVLARRAVAEAIVGVGIPPLKELIQFAVDHEIPVYT